MEVKFKIIGLDCANCAAELERRIIKIDGVKKASISFMSQRMIIQLEETRRNEIINNIRKLIKKEESDVEVEEI